jgi:outer membrane protein assembly factor BamA
MSRLWAGLLCLAALLVFHPGRLEGQTQEARPVDGQESREGKFSWAAIPILFYQPETHLAFGAGGVVAYRPAGQPPLARPSSVYVYAVYSQLKQFQAQVSPSLYFKNETHILTAILDFEKYPNKFWGFGDDTPERAEQDYTPRIFWITASLQRRISSRPNLYLGLQFQLQHQTISDVRGEGALARGVAPGSLGGTVSGLGILFTLDTRDNIFQPSRGRYFMASTYFNSSLLGSDYRFVSLSLDFRTYRPGLAAGHVLAVQGLFQAVAGKVIPFYFYPLMGGISIMRGYYAGRYRDKDLAAVQAEYRLPLWWRFGLAVFGGLGNVSRDLDSFDLHGLKYSLGLGLRFKLLPSEGTVLRMDFALGYDSTGLYFTAYEAF